jgi:hypothetical protein
MYWAYQVVVNGPSMAILENVDQTLGRLNHKVLKKNAPWMIS